MATRVHDGHRERMRERIRNSGLSSLQEHEILEYILYAFVPRKDTNEIAHSLIERFGSFSGVLNADEKSLSHVFGMTANASLFISALPEIFRRYMQDNEKSRKSLKGRGVARAYIGTQLYGKRQEQVYAVALDAHDGIINSRFLSSGSADAVELNVRAVVDFALSNNASNLIIAHNHPSGSVSPSQKDLDVTREVLDTLSALGITLEDHLIFAGKDYYSFEENGLLERMKTAKNCLKEGITFYE